MKQLLFVLMVTGFASTVFAQGPGGRGNGGVLGLVSMEEVQKELSMTEAQVEKFTSLRGDRSSQQNLSREERQKQNAELAKKADEAVKTVLDEKQQQRLSELRIQRDGANSLTRAEVAEKLGLDDAQKEQIARIEADNTPTERPNFQNATPEEREKFMTAARERREKTNTALLAVLKPEQKEAFEKMQGARFTFPQRQGRRPAQ
ncbi:MAG: hypothetical protein JNL58_00315 [Planctomyces sp.]|nr:hypothetical protein [Planctomyces sp.]